MAIKIKKGKLWPYGVSIWENHINLAFELPEKEKMNSGRRMRETVKEDGNISLRIYDLVNHETEEISLEETWHFGQVYAIAFNEKKPENYGYQVLQNGAALELPYGGEVCRIKGETVYLFQLAEFDWAGDMAPNLDFDELYIYKLHVRGFTKQASSKVEGRGTFEGAVQKIPYLKELGVNAVELMPVYDFHEVIKERCNYWGYGAANFMAPKPEYALNPEKAGDSFKELVKAFHIAGMEVYLEIMFPEAGFTERKLACLRHWVLEYHVDGFHLSAGTTAMPEVLSDPVLVNTKIMSENFDGSQDRNWGKRRGIYHNGFQESVRRFLRGDEDSAAAFMNYNLNRSVEQGSIQYLTNNNGFTLMDLVSYDGRHNEANGENNLDGMSWNLSWNCGEEGPSRKKDIIKLRKQQIKNAWIMNIFHQGTPLIYAGDEFGNTQKGNNNAWCQDNALSWLNWNLLAKNGWIFEFVKTLIELRKKEVLLHPVLPFGMDDKSLNGMPDMSFHGKTPWFVEDAGWSRCLGCMYAGEEKAWYFAYNMYTSKEEFALPRSPKNSKWKVYLDTAEANDPGSEMKDGRIEVEGHSIVLLYTLYE